MTIHTRRKRRTQQGGLVPGFTSLKVKFFGEDSLTRVKEIAITNSDGTDICEDITNKNNPILFAIRENMKNFSKFQKAGKYYFPHEDDTSEMKVAKCKRLNELRSKWLEIKKNEMNTGEKTVMSKDNVLEQPKYSSAIVDKNMLGNVDTRYFSYLMMNYCNREDESAVDDDDACIKYDDLDIKVKGGKNSSKKRQMYKRTRKARLNGTRFKSSKSRRNNRSKRHTRKRSHA